MQERTKSKFDEAVTYDLHSQPFLFLGFHQKVHQVQVRDRRHVNFVTVRIRASRGEMHEYVVDDSATDKYMQIHKEDCRLHAAVMLVRDATFGNVALHIDDPLKTYTWAFNDYPTPEIHHVRRETLRAQFASS
jgi:hypothetical protein